MSSSRTPASFILGAALYCGKAPTVGSRYVAKSDAPVWTARHFRLLRPRDPPSMWHNSACPHSLTPRHFDQAGKRAPSISAMWQHLRPRRPSLPTHHRPRPACHVANTRFPAILNSCVVCSCGRAGLIHLRHVAQNYALAPMPVADVMHLYRGRVGATTRLRPQPQSSLRPRQKRRVF